MSLFAAILALAAAYAKVDYVGDAPRPHPDGKAPGAVTVVVDPGHGGAENGAKALSGRWEKTVNLLLAQDVRAALTNLGYRVVLTREGDRSVGLYERPAVAVLNDADAFMSIHHNAPPEGEDPAKVRYRCVYSWNPLGAALSASVAEALASVPGGLPATSLPCDARHANFAVTRNPETPSILVEADFVTHPEGDRDAWDENVRRRVAAAIARGFDRWRRRAK